MDTRPRQLPLRGLLLGLLLPAAGAAAILPAWTRTEQELRGQAWEGAIQASQRRLERGPGRDLWSDHSSWKDPFRARTDSYQVSAVHSGRAAMEVADALQAMLPFYQADLGREYVPWGPRPVRLLPGIQQYNAFGNEYAGAESSVLGAFWATQAPGRPIAAVAHSSLLLTKIETTHVAALQWLDEAFPNTPDTWVRRGLASYFSLYYWDFRWAVNKLRSYQEAGRCVPLRTLLGEDLESYMEDPDVRFTQLGVLFAYLLKYREDTRSSLDEKNNVLPGPFAEYLRIHLEGGDPRQHPLHTSLIRDLDRLERELVAFDFGL